MNKPMFSLLGYQRPQSNIYATAIIDGVEYEYSATRTKEVLNVYDKVVSTGEKYVMASIHKNKPATMLEEDDPKIQVGGVWKDYAHIVGVNVKEDSVLPLLEDFGFEIKRNKPNVVKVKGLKYNVLSDVKVTYDVTTNGNSVENFLYNPNKLSDLIEEKQLDMSWLKKKNYRVLTDTEDIMEWLDGLDKTEEIVGFDTETTGLLMNSSRKDIIVGICMSYEDNAGVYFPLNHIRMDNVEMGIDEFIKLLKPYVDKRSKKRKKLVTHNGGFDWRVMKSLDIYLNIVFDTFLRYSLMQIDDSKNIMGLKPMAQKMLGIDVIELTDMYVKKSPVDVESVKEAVFEQGLPVNSVTKYKLERANGWEDLQYDFRFAPYDFVEVYGSADADFPRLIHKMLDKKWDKALDMVYNIEIGVIPAIGEQEYYGVKAIEEEFVRLNEITLKKLEVLEKDIYSLVGRKFDVSSPQQKSKVLFEDFQCPKLERFKTKTGSYGSGKGVLETLGGYKTKDGSPMYPVVDLFSKHTKLSKLVSSFYGKLPQLIHDGHLYPSYMSMGAETGRFSCSKPNLQQTEPTSRNYMVCDSDEYYFMICDYSQVEYRIMAGLSQEKKVIDFFSNNPEADYHIMGATRSSIKLVA